ncbi:glucosyl-3-phosphoglycerate synthase [Thermopolyspora flexuosa]|uniref:Glucosyl-3-phosphoglycerate synthase n=2 Tax=Thermopolyspora flexuosa TaxID=103836 RepID=A0A543J1J5_9ACTN|nr:glucosyl-3-phosphoglycerate synthase [Thermopolyspora flexuosa]TQM76692.1 glucosyl-3-phosphoglycerate synthase [Thermopolyspora flexuosa]GGM86069.1 glucosyl-3-phosphoglycerate synthase [Thermopolyspora flexuosa]
MIDDELQVYPHLDLDASSTATLARVREWMRRNRSAAEWTAAELVAAKRADGADRTISVVLPARDEQETVGDIVATIRAELVEAVPLVDEILVVDSRSTDDTAKVAAAAGARVVHQDAVLPELPPMSGKGEALWKGLAAAQGDLIVFIDADLRNFGAHFVTGLLGPLLTDPGVVFVKGGYERPLVTPDGVVHRGDGGRVTELVARPMINLYWPELAGFVQPLAGEYAARREVLERVPFVTEYGVELGLLIDLLEAAGLDAMAQVDLGVREHRHQSTAALGRMAAQIMLTAWSRLERQGRVVTPEPLNATLLQFDRDERGRARVSDVSVAERPPLASVLADLARAGSADRG